MYARLVRFKMGPGTQETADMLREKFSQALKAAPGLETAYFMADYESGTISTLALWKTKEAGEAAFQSINPKLQDALQGLVEEKPLSEFYKVVEVAQPQS